MKRRDAVIIGGGFFGCCIALMMRGYFDDVVILEKEDDLLKRASSINQARLHTGFHYPRSLLTAYRSFVNFPRFALDFRKAIIGDFTKVYSIAKRGSKISSLRFYEMFRRMGARIDYATPEVRALFNPDLIDESFIVDEMAFDAVKLRDILRERIDLAGIETVFGAGVHKVEEAPDGRVRVCLEDGEVFAEARYVFNCTYSNINTILHNSGLERLPFKHELTEMALVKVPDEIRNIGVTVMDGPFFSVMPYPSRGLHSLSHVRYTPHFSWVDTDAVVDSRKFIGPARPESNYTYMLKDSQRYMPLLKGCEYVESMFEVKTVLQLNEIDDGRPILFRVNHGIRNFSVVMGGKIDNIYDVLELISNVKEELGLKPKDAWKFLLPGN